MPSRIFYKLIIAVGTIAVLVIALFSYLISSSQYTELLEHEKRAISELSETIKSSTKHDMLTKNRERVHLAIDTIGQQEGIKKVRIFNKEGEIIFSSDKREMNTMVDKHAEACYACHAEGKPLERLTIAERARIFEMDGERQLGLISAIYNEPSCWTAGCHAHDESQKVLGVLDMTTSLTRLDAQVRANQWQLALLAGTMAILLAALLWVLVRKLIGEPVSRLVEATNVVAQGRLDYQIPVTARDELGDLARSFNEMTTRLAAAQEQVYRQDKLASLGRLCAGVAHELNNPLTGILTYASFLLKRAGGEEKTRSDLEVVVRETKRCRTIVKSLLDFSRQNPTTRSPVSINEILENTLGLLENQFALNRVALKKSLRGALPEVLGDGGQLQQVFLNIIVNALDAMEPSGGVLGVVTDVEAEAQTVVVRISDGGCGMSPQTMAKIFEPFYSTKGQKGTGLGLSVVWGIIEHHHGRISVASELGKGTTFEIRLPARADGGQSA